MYCTVLCSTIWLWLLPKKFGTRTTRFWANYGTMILFDHYGQIPTKQKRTITKAKTMTTTTTTTTITGRNLNNAIQQQQQQRQQQKKPNVKVMNYYCSSFLFCQEFSKLPKIKKTRQVFDVEWRFAYFSCRESQNEH